MGLCRRLTHAVSISESSGCDFDILACQCCLSPDDIPLKHSSSHGRSYEAMMGVEKQRAMFVAPITGLLVIDISESSRGHMNASHHPLELPD